MPSLFQPCFRVLTFAWLLALAFGAHADGRKLALVIGNDNYQNLDKLQKAVGDARGYRDVLIQLGYAVTLSENLTLQTMQQQIAQFQDILKPGDTAVLVYSGHGWSDGQVNYLLGTDAPADGTLAYMRRVSIPIQNGQNGVLDDIRSTGVTLQVAVIDACRNNPFRLSGTGRTLGLTRGLARIEPPTGVFLVHSAGAGEQALDRLSDSDRDRYSVFTRVFLPLLASGRPLNEVIKQAQSKVAQLASTIGHVQTPMYADQVTGDVCLRSVCATRDVNPSPPPAVDGDRLSYETALSSGSTQGWQAYLKRYPNGAYAGVAEIQLASLSRPSPSPAPSPAPTPDPTPVSGDTKDCADCPEMVRIPGGTFRMGNRSWIGRAEEKPVHDVTIRPFWAGKYEVTFAEWDACVAAGGCTTKAKDEGWGRGNRPVIDVSWNDAKTYAQWLSRKTGKAYRLLTEAEWEYVARAGTSTEYGWGNTASHEHANYGEDDCCGGLAKGRDHWEGTSPVASFPANAWGLYDLHGNVIEWTEDCWHDTYRGAPTDGSAWTEADGGECGKRVRRGGNYHNTPDEMRASRRSWNGRVHGGTAVGFRLARTD